MKKAPLAALLFAMLAVAYCFLLWRMNALLPERIASHFDAAGRSNGWMKRGSLLWTAAAAGLGLPLFLVALGYSIRILPAGLVNLPHKEHWLSSEQRAATQAWWVRHMWSLGCVEILFMSGLHYLLLRANLQPHPNLPTSAIVGLTIGVVIFMAWWITAIFLRFRKPATAP